MKDIIYLVAGLGLLASLIGGTVFQQRSNKGENVEVNQAHATHLFVLSGIFTLFIMIAYFEPGLPPIAVPFMNRKSKGGDDIFTGFEKHTLSDNIPSPKKFRSPFNMNRDNIQPKQRSYSPTEPWHNPLSRFDEYPLRTSKI